MKLAEAEWTRSGRGYLCPPGHALSYNPHLPQPAAGAKCILYFLVCISFLMQTIPIKNNCLSNCHPTQVFICKPIPSKPIQCRETERNPPKIHLIKLSKTYSLQPREARRSLSLSSNSSALCFTTFQSRLFQGKSSNQVEQKN